MKCSTSELQQRSFWCCSSLRQGVERSRTQRVMGIEPTWPAWKAGALPLSYTRDTNYPSCQSGQGGIRTPEDVCRQIYSLMPLATRPPARVHPTRTKLPVGVEPTTSGLQNRCSAIELR